MYTILAVVAMAVAAGATVLAIVGLASAQAAAAGAAAVCAAAFFVPGLAFYNYARKLRLRETALEHVAQLAHAAGTLDLDRFASDLRLSDDDARKILTKVVAEGHLRGRFDSEERFIVEPGPHCAACGAAIRSSDRVCATCGTRLGG